MGQRDTTGLDEETYRRLFRAATEASVRQMSDSARLNAAEDAAAQAVVEYWLKLEAGEKIRNDEAMVTTIAKRRAMDEQQRWRRRRHLRYGHDDLDGAEMLVPDDTLGREPSFMPQTDESWRQALIDLLRKAGDTIDEEIGVAVFLDGEAPTDVAERIGLPEKTVRNRMTAIRKTVTDSLAE